MAEADGNRTRQTEVLGLTGFEDRGAHQEPSRLRREPYTVVRTVPDASRGDRVGACNRSGKRHG